MSKKIEAIEEVEEEECDACPLLKSFSKSTANKGWKKSVVTTTPSAATVRPGGQRFFSQHTEEEEEEEEEEETPPNVEELGRSGWTVLHSMAAYWPERASESMQTNMSQFLRSFVQVYPCKICADDFKGVMEQEPPEPYLKTRADFSQWMCRSHNKVNEHLGKPIFDCKDVDRRWHIQSFFDHRDATQNENNH
eukprot:TRINITY_DN18129_c0_g1_i1.p1 TRINITY_DN18129_c0_g1~~TRINITY_DN18129_c0_g1_i1.p1  ORF type:complete len:193 (-),score=56.30 TRINITY_DN18129_c0_g1_i1:11-589(-)